MNKRIIKILKLYDVYNYSLSLSANGTTIESSDAFLICKKLLQLRFNFSLHCLLVPRQINLPLSFSLSTLTQTIVFKAMYCFGVVIKLANTEKKHFFYFVFFILITIITNTEAETSMINWPFDYSTLFLIY